jgi:hypothetical protein
VLTTVIRYDPWSLDPVDKADGPVSCMSMSLGIPEMFIQ